MRASSSLSLIPDQMVGARHAYAGHGGLWQADVLQLRDLQTGDCQLLREQLDRDVDVNIVS